MAETRSPASLKHVAALGFPGMSHALSLFNLTMKLAKAAPEVHFSYCHTARYTRSLFSTHNAGIPTNLTPCNVEDGLLEGYDLSKSRHEEYDFFVGAVPGNLELGMSEAAKQVGRGITCLISDALLSSSIGSLAARMGIPWLAVMTSPPHFVSVELHADEIPTLYKQCLERGQSLPEEQTLEAIPGLSVIRFKDLRVALRPFATVKPVANQVFLSLLVEMRTALPKASAVLFSSYEDLVPVALVDDLRSKLQNVLYIGTLAVPDEALPGKRSSPPSPDASGCLVWLDGKEETSVLYICFGTVAPVPAELIIVVAEALEAGKSPFLWSLSDMYKEFLPSGFIERTSELGKVVPWAPQYDVLSHPSVAVHVTHCGYNSVCESILAGVPMIACPLWAESFMNTRIVQEEWGIGVGVEVEAASGRMLDSLEVVIHHDKGKELRDAVRKLRQTVVEAVGVDGKTTKDFRSVLQIVS